MPCCCHHADVNLRIFCTSMASETYSTCTPSYNDRKYTPDEWDRRKVKRLNAT